MLRGIVERQLDDNQKLMALVSDLQQQRNLLTSEWACAGEGGGLGACVLTSAAGAGVACVMCVCK
jgi:hypothetical protein